MEDSIRPTGPLSSISSCSANWSRCWPTCSCCGPRTPRMRASRSDAACRPTSSCARYVRGCRPLVLTDLTRDWPAMQRWSPQDLKARFGHLEVEIQAERNADLQYEQNKLQAASRRCDCPISSIRVLTGGPTNDYYMTANNEVLRRPEFAPLLADIGTLPPYCDTAQLQRLSSFWFGPAGTVTPLHHDTLMLLHTQIVGRKRWRSCRHWRLPSCTTTMRCSARSTSISPTSRAIRCSRRRTCSK